jgi:ATPase, YjeE family
MKKTISTTEAMHAEGVSIAETLGSADIVTLTGELGAGKTTLTKGILSYFGVDPDDVTSPTFSIMNIYHAIQHNASIQQIVHIDTYRLEKQTNSSR